MKFLTIALMALFTSTAFAGFQGYNGTTSLGVFNKIKCSTGLSCTKSADTFSVISSPSITGSPLTLTGASSTASFIDLKANANASSGDDWKIESTASQGGLKLSNNVSGSQVQKLLLDTSGNLSVAGTLAMTGASTFTGGVAQSALDAAPRTIVGTWNPGATANATSVTPSATELRMTQIFVPYNTTLTGAAVLNGATCGTNKWIVAIFNSAGTALKNSSTAGTLCSGTSAFQKIDFTATVAVKGPATYWIGLYADGTTDRYFGVPTLGQMAGLAGTVTAQTFGTVANVTLPTSFTADKGPIAYVY